MTLLLWLYFFFCFLTLWARFEKLSWPLMASRPPGFRHVTFFTVEVVSCSQSNLILTEKEMIEAWFVSVKVKKNPV